MEGVSESQYQDLNLFMKAYSSAALLEIRLLETEAEVNASTATEILTLTPDLL